MSFAPRNWAALGHHVNESDHYMLDAAITWQYETSLARLIAKDCFPLNQELSLNLGDGKDQAAAA